MSFSFGSPSSAPATTGIGGGSFNFGATKPATPGFGLNAGAQPTTALFNTPATSAPAIGSTAPAFGTATPAFGATSAAPTFGVSTTPAFGSLPSFGSSGTPAFGASSTAPTFGTTSTAPTFGTTPAFGATTTPAFGSTATTTPAFGATTTPAFGTTGGLTFGAASSTATPGTGLSFGAPTATTASTGLGGLGGIGFGASTSTQNSSLLFGGTATTTNSLFGENVSIKSHWLINVIKSFNKMFPRQSSPYTSPFVPITQTFQMLPPISVSTNAHPNFELSPIEPDMSRGYSIKSPTRDCYKTLRACGAKLGTTSVTGTQPSISATPSFGLGGVAPVGGAGVGNVADVKTEPPKQQKLPNEISTTLDSFKEFVKKQKAVSSEMMRVSIKPLHKVAREAESTLRATLTLSGEVSRARAHSRRLRAAAAAALAAADNAARDNAAQGMELESSAPPGYVKELISELEQQLITFRRQMEVADKQMQSSPKLLTEQELTLGIRRMHESLVALAGRLQAVHAQVEAQKDQYLNLRKYVLKDPTNVFDSPDSGSSLDQILKDAETSRKKIKSGNVSDVSFNSAVLSDPRAALGNIHQLAGPTPFTYLGNTLSPFPIADASGPGWQPTPQSQLNTSINATPSTEPALQLHKPPGKRGKQSY
ncbi:unnamed protein product [Diatraea saccharalis]|uniref:Nucleoporin Nup58 n=1 Tax=Diatraea saccharalis TaxID=40085 RepID=A0A9N9N132_9NEOP|nr:unnamed protein product [Diatraea saccharalis]